jgi:hypothetical protein
MEVVGTIVVLAIIAVALGVLRNAHLARSIGREVNAHRPAEDPVVLLEKLNRLRETGALTEEEFETQKARILGRG